MYIFGHVRCVKFKIGTNLIVLNCMLAVVLTSSRRAKRTQKERYVYY